MAAPEVAAARALLLEAIDRIVAAADGLAAEAVSWRPVAEASSIGALALHIVAVAEQSVLTYLCQLRDTPRDRDAEFAPRGEDGVSLAARWTRLRGDIDAALEALPGAVLDEPRHHHTFGDISARELLDRLVAHAFEHAGQAELTRQLWDARRAG